jgi:hypothetical protein
MCMTLPNEKLVILSAVPSLSKGEAKNLGPD